MAHAVSMALNGTRLLNSTGHYGGAVLFSGYSSSTHFFEVIDVVSRDTVSEKAGGVVFFSDFCDLDARPLQFCSQMLANASNYAAGTYGPACASQASRVVGLSQVFGAPGQSLAPAFSILDPFNVTVSGIEQELSAVVVERTGSIKIRTGETRDTAAANENGLVSFDDFFLQGSPGSSAVVQFTTGSGVTCKGTGKVPSVNVTFVVAGCLPGYFASSVSETQTSCELCPAQTYALQSNQTECEPCREEGEAGEQDFSCLIPPDLLAAESSNLAKERRQRNAQVWLVSSGFYPSPPEEPEELLKCPNHACLALNCTVSFPFNSPYLSAPKISLTSH